MSQETHRVVQDCTRELILNHTGWETALRSLLVDGNLYAVGSLRRNETPGRFEWLTDDLGVLAELPLGRDDFPLTSRVVISVEPEGGRTPEAILLEMVPRESQTILVIVFQQEQRSRWEGIVYREGVSFPLDGIRVVGSGMLHLRRQAAEPEPVPTAGRWSRTAGALGQPLWQRVSTAHVLLVGCGRNGTLAAWQFAGLGVSRLTLVDGDVLEAHNLDAMPGLTTDDIGKLKATALAERLVAFNPELSIHCFTKPITDVLGQLQSRFDLIVSCVDRDAARVAASWLSRKKLVPHLDIGTAVQRSDSRYAELTGDIRLLLPFAGCVHCVGGIADRDATMYEFAAPPNSLFRGEPIIWNQQRAGSLIHLNSMVLGLAVEHWLSLYSPGSGSIWQRMSWSADGLEPQASRVGPADECPHCQEVR